MTKQYKMFAAGGAVALMVLAIGGGAIGAIGADEVVSENWKQLDANGDGRVTAVENRANADAAFKKVDSNGDGTVSRVEYFTAMQAGAR